MVHQKEDKLNLYNLRFASDNRNSFRNRCYNITKEVVKHIGAWAFTLFVFGLIFLGIQYLTSCSGVPKSTINMQNCVIVESPADGSMTVKCDLAAEDKQLVEKLEKEKNDNSKNMD